jgi:hypothetical protein
MTSLILVASLFYSFLAQAQTPFSSGEYRWGSQASVQVQYRAEVLDLRTDQGRTRRAELNQQGVPCQVMQSRARCQIP